MEEKITLAVTDDHKLIRESVIDFLTDMGFDVLIEATNGTDLLEQLNNSTRLPQVCLLDYNMPGMKGYELASVLSKEYPDIKLAALTSNASFPCLVEMIGNGCKAYFIKNSDPQEWEIGIKELVHNGHYFTKWMQQELLTYIQNYHKSL